MKLIKYVIIICLYSLHMISCNYLDNMYNSDIFCYNFCENYKELSIEECLFECFNE